MGRHLPLPAVRRGADGGELRGPRGQRADGRRRRRDPRGDGAVRRARALAGQGVGPRGHVGRLRVVTAPPPYPRIAHVLAGRGSRDDLVLSAAEVASLWSRPLLVEEKLDGATVVLWREGGRLECALRSGPGGQDRARQLGPLRAWLAPRSAALGPVLAEGASAVYAEWLLLTHSVHYDRLSDYLVGLDVLGPSGAFLDVDGRDAVLAAAGLVPPPRLHRGMLGGVGDLEALLGRSSGCDGPMEGLIVRTLDGTEPRIAKLVRPGFSPAPDEAWRGERPRNQLADRDASWH
ncbi:MAG: hypothetical protein GEV08_07285 [Acidimicrobiia bacterium]|nr:hypothetical protein [Acidimicrobiia bacterium]